ncbi:arylesterase [Pseudaminobacter sp. 19-2017]|uniref:Arylesterase n=1 Tax=Pseudaminobacter soli (ex Zhang et al. 2022) TaxID=2831468 RepID=A0A942E3R9_9HYPH|nr:arylesterase [Pseudaminobacter soli]MBS3647967.1 arylesterase [Pseudaminobacter soli]
MSFKRLLFFVLALVIPFGAASAEPRTIVGFGDSLMAGFGLDTGQSFPEKLQAALKERGHDVVITNAGVSGDTTSGGLSRLDWSVPDGTDIVILELGANDMLRGVGPEVTRKNLEAMIKRLKERGIAVLLAGMLAAPNLGPDYQAKFNAIYPELAKQYGLAFHPFFLDGVAGDRKFLLEDGMHPNAAGVDRMVESFLPTMEAMLREQGAS